MNSFSLIQILCISMLLQLAIGSPLNSFPVAPKKSMVPAFDLASLSESESEECSTENSKFIGTASGKASEKKRWRNGFFVQPDPAFTEDEVALINDAMYDLQQVLCIPVMIWPQDSTPVGDYAFILKAEKGSGCFSRVGKQGGKQIINIAEKGCVSKHTITHESIHALGFDHEQNRPDRDDYVDILKKNIKAGKEHNFEIAKGSLTFGVPYDYVSIMHYSSSAFANKTGQSTMLKKDGGLIGQNTVISTNDALKLKKMYNCIIH